MINAYDEIAYPPAAFRETHPEVMATYAILFGLPPPVERRRVLEIGAGDGSNLIPMAMGLPDSHFVGFDLAGEPVRRGNEMIEALGLTNIALRQANILDIDLGPDPFDYIIAHGVYSWVPPETRDAMMRLVGRSLAPAGVAFVSYNALPGGYIRLAIRQDLLLSTRGIPGRTARIDAAMRRLQAWPQPSPNQGAFQNAVAEEVGRMRQRSAAILAHDELSDSYHPVYLDDFAAHCAENGLQILGEAAKDVADWLLAPDAPAEPPDALLARNQQADFTSARFFRQSLLVGADLEVRRRPPAGLIATLHVASGVRRTQGDNFEAEGLRFSLGDPILAGVLERLAAIWPATAPADSLGLDEGRVLALLRLHGVGALELHAAPSRFITAAGDRPMASPLARLQARRGQTRLTTLRHTMRDLEDDFSCSLLASLDGARTRAEIARDVAPRFNLTPEGALAPLGVFLDVLAHAPLLVQ